MKSETLKTENYVKYKNAFNRANLGGLSVLASNLLMAIASKVVNHGTAPVYFTDKELTQKELIGSRTFKDMIKALNIISDSLIKISSTITTEEYTDHVGVFERFRVFNEEKSKVRLMVIVQPEYAFLFNELQDNFTVFELRDFASLRSTRSKTLYRFLKQFRTTGEMYLSLDDVLNFFNVPKNYLRQKKYIKDKILDPATKECSVFFTDLRVESVKEHKRGNPVKGYRWTFKAETPRQKNSNQSKSKKTNLERYNDFKQRDYDYAELERQLANSPNN